MNAGATSTIAGQALTIAAGTVIENAYGGDGNDTITGNSAANQLFGGRGADVLDGGAGADTMIGGTGDDIYLVDNAGDVVTENVNEGSADMVYAIVDYWLSANVENLILQGAGLQGYGNALANMIFGNTGGNLLDGGAGSDALLGGAGSDAYFVDNANDTVVENLDVGSDTVFATAHFGLAANVENLILQGAADLQGIHTAAVMICYGRLAGVLPRGQGLEGDNILDQNR